jgi:atypical dual specificity phosphatase
MPPGFTWVDPPHLAALAFPDADDLAWLRRHGVDLLVSLTEDPPPRRWVNDAGLMTVHIPVPDLAAPSARQLELAVNTLSRAKTTGLGVAVHCAAGKGRTGTILAAYWVAQGLTATDAIRRVRESRPGSVETGDQERAVAAFEAARRT